MNSCMKQSRIMLTVKKDGQSKKIYVYKTGSI